MKRETVSVSANLEVISQESFIKRLEGMSSSCANCRRKRTHNNKSCGRNVSNGTSKNNNHRKMGRRAMAGRRKQIIKANTPIVVHLQDSLRASRKLRQSSLDMDSDVSCRSTDEEQSNHSSSSSGGDVVGGCSSCRHSIQSFADVACPCDLSNGTFARCQLPLSIYSDVASIPEFVPQTITSCYPRHEVLSMSSPYKWHRLQTDARNPLVATQLKSPYYGFQSTLRSAHEKSRKNLTAFISVIEKAHMKEPTKDIEPNLSENQSDGKPSSLLNNSVCTLPLKDCTDLDLKRKNMEDCNNVELICNDLSTNAEKLTESTDESDTSDKASVFSSSDAMSDDMDASDLPVLEEEVKVHEFSAEELEQLTQFTTGAPLIRYDCHQPSEDSKGRHVHYLYSRASYLQLSRQDLPASSTKGHHQSQQCQKPREMINSYAVHYPPLSRELQRMPTELSSNVEARFSKSSVSTDSDASSDVDEHFTTSSTSSSSSSSSFSPSSCGQNRATVSAKACLNTSNRRRKPHRNSPSANNHQYRHHQQPQKQPHHNQRQQPHQHNHSPHHMYLHQNWYGPAPLPKMAAQHQGSLRLAPGQHLYGQGYGLRRPSYQWIPFEKQLWDIDVSHPHHNGHPLNHNHHASGKGHRQGHANRGGRRRASFSGDCVYMDLTGLDITYSVVYPSDPEFTSWSTMPYQLLASSPSAGPSLNLSLQFSDLTFPIKIACDDSSSPPSAYNIRKSKYGSICLKARSIAYLCTTRPKVYHCKNFVSTFLQITPSLLAWYLLLESSTIIQYKT